MKILYIGGFQLPDKNAAAQRVINIAKALRDLNNEVYFLNAVKEKISSGWTDYFNFKCYEYSKASQFRYLTNIKTIKKIIDEKYIDAVIAYNYPAIALNRLVKYCKKHGIKIFGDVTEWYVPQGNFIYRIIKSFDSNFRMKKIHLKMDGIIAISEYLYQYYKSKINNTIKIPPLVDIRDEKWQGEKMKNKICTFVYAGNPDSQKERLDLIVKAVDSANGNTPFRLNVIGVTKEQYEHIYKIKYCGTSACFYGRMSHLDVIQQVKNADWSIIIREDNLVTRAGFPTKVVESISCGTPIISNVFSNITDYLKDCNSLIVYDISQLESVIEYSINKKFINVDRSIFDYHKYLIDIGLLFNGS